MRKALAESCGRLVAVALAGSWRHSPPVLECSATELEEIAPLLLSSGAGALAWWRIRHSALRDVPAAQGLHQAYRLNTLQAALQQRTIAQVITRLRAVEIEPILVKGWAVARLYPELGLRPRGDIDLCVRPEQFAAAEAALRGLPAQRYGVDLHRGFEKFGGGSVEGCYARSRLIKLGETEVRVLSAEDHLRVLSTHMLREGAWRPVWLCDVAAAVESRPANFAWASCLTEERRLADWVSCALRLAHQLLGADIRNTPAAQRSEALPGWILPTILHEWAAALPSMSQRHRAPMASYLRHPAGVWQGLRHRWPNPIEATVSLHGRFNALPRFPFQIGTCLARAAKFVARLPKSLRAQG